jgi:hypothetical protein
MWTLDVAAAAGGAAEGEATRPQATITTMDVDHARRGAGGCIGLTLRDTNSMPHSSTEYS